MSEDLKLFEQLGLELPAKPNSSGQFVLDCPFSDCGKESHFFLSAKTGQWSCKVCSRKGNKYSFLKQLYEDCLSTTKVGTYKRLSLKRKKFPPQAFIDSRIAHHKGLNAWLYPTWDTKGSVLNIGIYNGDGAVLGLAGLKQHLFGLETLEAKGPIYLCYSADTEVLTEYGWKLFSELDDSDKVAAFNRFTERVSFEKPSARQVFDYSGEMVHFKSRWCDLLVTPEHRVVYRWATGKSWSVKQAVKIGQQVRLPVAGYAAGSLAQSSPTPEQVNLLVAFVADGHVEARGCKLHWAFKKKRKVKRFKRHLNALGIAYEVRHHKSHPGYTDFYLDRNDDNVKFLLKWCPNKTWTGEELRWPLEIRQRLLRELAEWDGDCTNTNNVRYFTSKEHEADIINRMAVTSGYGSQVRMHERPDRPDYSPEYVVQIIEKNARTLVHKPGRTAYKGKVYCCTVSTGCLIVRRNGKALVSGNCEGQHDAVSLRYLLSRFDSHNGPYTVLAVPGSSSLPKSDIELLRNRDVYLLYDNDDAGRNGIKAHASTLHKICSSVHVLAWPENRFPDKYDVDDYIREGKERPEQLWSDLLSWCFRYGPGADPTAPAPHVIRTSINAILKDFKETDIHVFPSMKDSLILTCAIAHSINIPGEPLWMYLIGQPGAGKSLILESTLGSKNCLYRTSVTHKSFLSGFKGDGGPDTSLLAIIPGKCLIVKDYSNVLSLPAAEQDQLVSLLREAYDGRIVRSYGNQVYREYPPADSPFKDCRFSFVAGVTREIHARSHAGLGERFLKFEMDPTDGDNLRAIQAAVDDSWKSHDHSLQRMAGVGSFLDRELDWSTLPNIPKWYRNRIIALAQWVGLCRTPVARTQGDLDYDPSPESGTRVVKQFLKLSQAVAMTLNLKSAESETYRLVRKVAWDTAHGWRRNLFQIFAQDQFLSATDIVNALDYSHSTVHRVIKDMVALSILKRTKSTPNPTGHGKPLQNWRLTDKAKVMWQTAKLGDL